MKAPIATALVCASAALAAPAAAHHPASMFDWRHVSQLRDARVERWMWTAPRTYLYVRDAQGRRWAFEGPGAGQLAREGWSQRSLVPGEKVSLSYHALRNGRRGGFSVAVQKADGSLLRQWPARE